MVLKKSSLPNFWAWLKRNKHWWQAIALVVTLFVAAHALQQFILAQGYLVWMNNKQQFVTILIFVLLLLPLNWFLEVWRWKILCHPLYELSWRKSIQGVLYGIMVGLVTPNRLGEIGGKIAVLPTFLGPSCLSCSGVGALAQLIANWFWGGIALIVIPAGLIGLKLAWLGGIILASTCIAALLFVNINNKVGQKFLFKSRIKKVLFWLFNSINLPQQNIELTKNITSKNLAVVLLLSLLRYVVYALQYWLILILFCPPIMSMPQYGIPTIAAVLFIQQIAPTVGLLEPALRGTIAAVVLKQTVCSIPQSAVAATILLWAVNLLLPTFLGWFLYFKRAK